MLFLCKQGCKPEQYGSAENAETYKVKTVDAVKHGVLSDWRHESPEGAGAKHTKVCNKGLFLVIHKVFLLFDVSRFGMCKINNK